MRFKITVIPVQNAIQIIPTLVLLILLAGCETPNIRDDFTFDPAQESALIIGSVSENLGTSKTIFSEFFLDYSSKQPTKTLYSKDYNELIGPITAKYEFQDEKSGGRIFAIEVSPGRHAVDHWNIEHKNNFTLYPKSAPPALEFKINAGEIMYIGNFSMLVESGRNFFGMPIPVGGVPSVHNKSERDMTIFRQKYPQLSDQKIIVNVLHEGLWVNKVSEDEELVVPKSSL